MPSRRLSPGPAGHGFKDLVTGGFGLQSVRPASATRHLRRIDQVDGRHLSADGA